MAVSQLEQFMNGAQAVAGAFSGQSVTATADDLRGLLDRVPLGLTRADQAIVAEVVERLLAYLVRIVALDRCGDVTGHFLTLAMARPRFETWREECYVILDLCEEGIAGRSMPWPVTARDPRVQQMIRLIDARYADATLNLQCAAGVAALSYWHAARLLKQHTGKGFVTHLRHRRLVAARELLIDTSLSMKEIAAKVGYVHASQFTREFSLACGLTPRAFRIRQGASGAIEAHL